MFPLLIKIVKNRMEKEKPEQKPGQEEEVFFLKGAGKKIQKK